MLDFLQDEINRGAHISGTEAWGQTKRLYSIEIPQRSGSASSDGDIADLRAGLGLRATPERFDYPLQNAMAQGYPKHALEQVCSSRARGGEVLQKEMGPWSRPS